MRIIISPAKQMQTDTDTFACSTLPVFMEKTKILMQWIRSLTYEEQKKLWACNDKIARQNVLYWLTTAFSILTWLRRSLRMASMIMYRSICGSCPDFMA